MEVQLNCDADIIMLMTLLLAMAFIETWFGFVVNVWKMFL